MIILKWANRLKTKHLTSICKLSTTTAELPKEKKIKVGEHEINYIKVGEGDHKVLFVNGAFGTIWTAFKPQIEGFDKQKFTVIAWDQPGCGKSRPPEKEFPPDFYEKDAQVAIDFMKALNIPKYSILAWSDGGKVGMIQAAKAADSVHKLVLLSTNSFILPEELVFYKGTTDMKTWSRKNLQPMVEVYGAECFAKLWSKWYDGQVAVFNKNKGDICSSLLEHIKCPTFVLYGEKDPLMVIKAHVAHLQTNISNSRIHLYPEGKHNIHLQYADDFNRRVQEFLLLP